MKNEEVFAVQPKHLKKHTFSLESERLILYSRGAGLVQAQTTFQLFLSMMIIISSLMTLYILNIYIPTQLTPR